MKDNNITKIIFLMGVPFILGVGAGWIVQGRHWDVFLTSYVPALATLVAAFYGAKYAFQFQKDKAKGDERRLNVVNGNSVIFTMMRMITTLRNVQKQIIEPSRSQPAPFLQMRPTQYFSHDIRLNIESLYFLLETDERNILGEVVIEDQRYQSAVQSINERSRIHKEEVQPLLERAGVVEGVDYSLRQIENALGERLYKTLQLVTEDMINDVDGTILSLKAVADKLRESLKRIYPDDKIISFDIT
jgi:hypothetical protein